MLSERSSETGSQVYLMIIFRSLPRIESTEPSQMSDVVDECPLKSLEPSLCTVADRVAAGSGLLVSTKRILPGCSSGFFL